MGTTEPAKNFISAATPVLVFISEIAEATVIVTRSLVKGIVNHVFQVRPDYSMVSVTLVLLFDKASNQTLVARATSVDQPPILVVIVLVHCSPEQDFDVDVVLVNYSVVLGTTPGFVKIIAASHFKVD